jgi:hypothetical protein
MRPVSPHARTPHPYKGIKLDYSSRKPLNSNELHRTHEFVDKCYGRPPRYAVLYWRLQPGSIGLGSGPIGRAVMGLCCPGIGQRKLGSRLNRSSAAFGKAIGLLCRDEGHRRPTALGIRYFDRM